MLSLVSFNHKAMTKLEKKLRASIRRMGIGANSAIIIAVSGGADSTAMFDALVRSLRRNGSPNLLVAAHLNHQLRGAESDADEKFVEEMAARSGLTCVVERFDVADQARRHQQNLEATARRIRYDFLRRVAEKLNAEMVLTAHTRDDQVETILMRWLRGSGAEGLRGIHQTRPLGEKVKLVRPMLDVTRNEVLLHCRHYHLPFRTDSSNLSVDFTRNRVRRELLPLLRGYNPQIDQTLLRTSQLITDDDDYLRRDALDLYNKLSSDRSLDLEPLIDSHPAIRRRVIRHWLGEIRGGLQRVDAIHLHTIEQLILDGQSGSQIHLPGGWRVRREFDRLTLSPAREPAPETKTIILQQDTELYYFGNFRLTLRRNVPRESVADFPSSAPESYTALLRECKELSELKLRPRSRGDAYIPAGRHHKIKLKSLMIRHKIPISQRNNYPVLVTVDEQIVWSPGLPIAEPFRPKGSENEERYVLVIAELV